METRLYKRETAEPTAKLRANVAGYVRCLSYGLEGFVTVQAKKSPLKAGFAVQAEFRSSALDISQAQVLHLQVFVHAVARTLPPQA
jgi:hypothetical protein